MLHAAISKPIDVTQYENAMSSVSAPESEASSGGTTEESEAPGKKAVREDRELPTPSPATSDKSTSLPEIRAPKIFEHDTTASDNTPHQSTKPTAASAPMDCGLRLEQTRILVKHWKY